MQFTTQEAEVYFLNALEAETGKRSLQVSDPEALGDDLASIDLSGYILSRREAAAKDMYFFQVDEVLEKHGLDHADRVGFLAAITAMVEKDDPPWTNGLADLLGQRVHVVPTKQTPSPKLRELANEFDLDVSEETSGDIVMFGHPEQIFRDDGTLNIVDANDGYVVTLNKSARLNGRIYSIESDSHSEQMQQGRPASYPHSVQMQQAAASTTLVVQGITVASIPVAGWVVAAAAVAVVAAVYLLKKPIAKVFRRWC